MTDFIKHKETLFIKLSNRMVVWNMLAWMKAKILKMNEQQWAWPYRESLSSFNYQ